MREWLNQNPRAGLGIVFGAVAIAAIALYFHLAGTDRGVDRVFYYDTHTGELFIAPNEGSPIRGPSDPADGEQRSAYIAHAMGCGTCDEDEIFAAYLRRNGAIRAPEGGPWVDAETDPRAREIRTARHERCEGVGVPRACYPR